MKKDYEKLDDAFKEGLGGYSPKPPEAIWKNVQSSIPHYKTSVISSFYKNQPVLSAFLTGVLFVSLVFSGYMIYKGFTGSDNNMSQISENTTQPSKIEQNNSINNASNIINESITSDVSSNTLLSEEETVKNPISAIKKNIVAEDVVANPTPHTSTTTITNIIVQEKRESNNIPGSEINILENNRMERNYDLSSIPSKHFNFSTQKPSELSLKHQLTSDYLKKEDDYVRPKYRYILSASLAPENHYNLRQNPLLTDVEKTYAAEINFGIYRKLSFFQFGVGAMRMQDNVNILFRYSSLDSVGSYLNVDSLTFTQTIDPISGQVVIVPQYHYTPVTVYDSVLHTETKQAQNFYTYLKLPVYAGFYKEFNRFSLYVKGGFVFNMIIISEKQNIELQQDNPTLVRIEDLSSQRLSTFSQLNFSLGASYRLNNRWHVFAEPSYHYYLSSVFSNTHKSMTGNPYSLGLKMGINFEF